MFIFLGFAKSFDTVNHDILLEKSKYHGIRGLQLKRFKSYLLVRHQQGPKSDKKTIICSVPQWSVLGSKLFLIYISDIYKSAPKVYFHLFADGTCLFYPNKSYKKMEIEANVFLDNIKNWLKANNMTLNAKKSNLLVFDSRKISNRNSLLSYLLRMSNLNKKTFQNTQNFILINNYQDLSSSKLETTNFIKQMVF